MPIVTTEVDYFRAQLYPPREHQPLAKTKLLVPLQDIAEVVTIQRQDICPIPGVAPGILGVANQRGQLIWIMDLCEIRGDEAASKRLNPQEKLTIMLLQQAQGQVGCVVAQLQGIVSLDLQQGQKIEAQWQTFYPFCDRQLSEGEDWAFLLDIMQLFEYLQMG
ncbi:CheW-like domain containing protein [[Synechococcus] sp. NIES-970]|nr:CheW-like domain containing protein [[Synechococcus] sp. NIES-970]